jgi:hypothetical protein
MSLRLLALTCFIFLSHASLAQQSSAVTDSPDSVCEQGTNLSGLIDEAQKQTLLSLTLESIRLVIAPQKEAPAQLVPPTSYGSDLLMAATLKNRSEKTIISYRIGWGYVLQSGIEFHTGALMSVPAGVKPGRIHNVRDQDIDFAPGAEQVIFFVAELTFANGEHWTAKKKDLRVRTVDLKNSRWLMQMR